MPRTPEEWETEFERLGPGEVRARSGLLDTRGLGWLALPRSSQAEQLLLAREARREAQTANKIATVALIVATISMVITMAFGVIALVR
jgi:predicted aspartyl protease